MTRGKSDLFRSDTELQGQRPRLRAVHRGLHNAVNARVQRECSRCAIACCRLPLPTEFKEVYEITEQPDEKELHLLPPLS